MIPSSRFGVVASFALALAVHAGFGITFFSDKEMQVAGDDIGGTDVQLGASFADIAIGVQRAAKVTAVTQGVEPSLATAVSPVETARVMPTRAPDAAMNATPIQVPTVEAAPAARPKPKPAPTQTPKSSQKEKAKTAAKSVPKGNSDANAKSGETAGKASSNDTRAGNDAKAAQKGDAAASNYPGKVRRKLAREPQPRGCPPGTAGINFVIDAKGRISSVSIYERSGNPKTDQMLMQQVRKASPYPKPPAGAQTVYTIKMSCR